MGLFKSIGKIFNDITGVSDSNEQYLQNWNMQNEYNTPKNQMLRYKDANLNPNLIYGQTNTSSPIQATPSASPLEQSLNMMSMYQNLKNARAQEQLLNSQSDNTKANTKATLELLPYQRDNLVANIGNTQANTWNTQSGFIGRQLGSDPHKALESIGSGLKKTFNDVVSWNGYVGGKATEIAKNVGSRVKSFLSSWIGDWLKGN